jgi:PKD repeat protein
MALSFVAASSAWVSGTAAVTPTAPAGLAVGDLVVLVLVSKYDDAVLPSDPVGWDTPGTPAVNTGRPTGNDNGNTRMRVFYRVWQSGDTMPSLAPTPNNVSTVHAAAYRSATGFYDVVAQPLADDTVGTPLAVTTPAIDLAVGDHLRTVMVLNGDVVTWGTTTVTASGITFGTATSAPADASTASGTDLRMRAMTRAVTAGTATSAVTVSTALAGTTTNAVGVVAVVRVREATAPPVASFSQSASDIVVGGSVTFTDTSTNTPTEWAWDFGAGASPATASTQGPHVVTYSTEGTKTVTLTATNAGGSDPSDQGFIDVYPVVDAVLTENSTGPYEATVTSVVVKFDTSIIGVYSGTGGTANIDWGDGSADFTDTFEVPGSWLDADGLASHVYATDGAFTITLTVNRTSPAAVTGSDIATVGVTVDPTTVVPAKIWNGIAFKTGSKVWNGTSWRTDAKVWNGTQWVPLG